MPTSAAVEASRLSVEASARHDALEQYRASGSLIVTRVFDASFLESLHAAWQGICDERKAQGKSPFSTLLMAHLSYPQVRAAVRHPALVAAVELLLGGKVDLIQSQLMFGAPGSGGFSPHQDNFYNRAEPRDGIIAAWIALEAVDESNGGVAVYPGSHRHGLVSTRRDWGYLLKKSPEIARSLIRAASPAQRASATDSGVMERFVYAIPPEGTGPVTPALEAGSVLFMHGDLIHSSAPNRTERFRRSLLTNYVRRGTSFNPGLSTARTPFDVYAAG